MTKLISLERLSLFFSDLKTWIKDYFDSRIDSDFSTSSANPVKNATVTDKFAKVNWQGKMSELDAAIESGEVEPGFTQIHIIDDDGDETLYIICSVQDIYDLFGLTYTG